jgi:hypothetical protein
MSVSRNFQLLSIAIIATAFLGGCATGEKAYNRGDYDTAVIQATKRLKSDADNENAIATLRQAYPAAEQLHLQNIERAERSSAVFKWETVVAEYDRLNRLADAIQRTPAAQSIVSHPQFYDQSLEAARESAAQARFSMGQSALDRGDRTGAREAFDHFNKALFFHPSLRAGRQKLAEARELATLNVLIRPIICSNREIDLKFVENNLRQFLNGYQPGDFVRFHTSADAAGVSSTNHVVEMKFDGFAVAESKIEEKTQPVQKNNVVVGRTNSDPPQEVLGTVKATVITYKRTVNSSARLDFKIIDVARSRVLNHKKFPGKHQWKHEWGTYRGDERALPPNLKKIANQRNVPPPGPQQLFAGFAEPIFSQACNELKRFYTRFR